MRIRVDAYSLTPSSLVVGTAGSYGIPKLECSFSPEWEGLSVKASFYAGEEDYVVILNEAGEATVPAEVMAEAGEYPFLISGSRGSDVIVSLAGKLVVLPTLEPAITPPESPTPSEMAQIYDMLEEARERSSDAVDCIAEARASAANADQSAANANRAANSANAAILDAYRAISRLVSVHNVDILDNGHLKVTLTNGETIDAGVCRGSAVSDEYTGNGGSKTVNLGFRPALLFLTKTSDGCTEGETAVVAGDGYVKSGNQLVELTSNGFTLAQEGSDGWNAASTGYRYVAFADDPAILSFELSGKLNKPASFTSGDLPVFAHTGQLTDSGKKPDDFAGAIVAESGISHSLIIGDAAGGIIRGFTAYGPNVLPGLPSVAMPAQPAVYQDVSFTVTSGSRNSTYRQMGLTLRGFALPQGSTPTITVDGTPLYCDSLRSDGTLNRRVGQKVFTGSENWSLSTTTAGLFYLSVPDMKIAAVNPCRCSHFRALTGYDGSEVASGDNFAFMHHVLARCYFKYTACTTVAEWKAFLAAQNAAGHPLTLLYQLATPSTTTVSVADLQNVQLYPESTTVTANGFVELEYLADTKRYIDRKIREATT